MAEAVTKARGVSSANRTAPEKLHQEKRGEAVPPHFTGAAKDLTATDACAHWPQRFLSQVNVGV